jgi:ABC-type amino acid transport substrate-binding protein
MQTAERHPPSATAAWVALLLSVAVAGFLFFGGRGSPDQAGGNVLDKVRKTKKIRAGYVVNVPQMSRDPTTGALSGYHYDLLNKIAAEAGFEVEYEETTFTTMGAALNTSSVDVVIGGGYESIPRAAEVAFTEPVMILALGYVARADDARFQSEADLRRPGIRVAVTAGGASADYQKEFMPEAQAVVLSRNELARVVLEVTSGRADVGIGNVNNCARFEKDHPTVRFVTRGKPFFRFTSGFVVRQGDPGWLQFLNSSIRHLQTNGFTDKLEAKYNPEGLFWMPVKRY